MPNPILLPLLNWARKLRYPTLFKVTAALFAITLLVPDPFPFVDEILRPASGVPAGIVIVCSAGNEGAKEMHEAGTVPANDSRQVQFYIPDRSFKDDRIDIWYNGTSSLDVTLTAPENPAQSPPNTTGPVSPPASAEEFTIGGMTIEVTNTDAEGRLILADAMTWAEREGATHIVDIATLTGAHAIAFGDQVSAYFARPREWGDRIGAAAEKAGEWFWEMPLATEYRPAYDSAHADMVNSGGRPAGAVRSTGRMRAPVTRSIQSRSSSMKKFAVRSRSHPFRLRPCAVSGQRAPMARHPRRRR